MKVYCAPSSSGRWVSGAAAGAGPAGEVSPVEADCAAATEADRLQCMRAVSSSPRQRRGWRGCVVGTCRIGVSIYYTPHPIGESGGHGIVGHTIEDKTRLLQRVRRLGGQVDAIERALQKDADCARVMQLTVSARGAANSLMAELLEDHIRMHVSDPAHDRDRGRARGAKHLIEVVHAYLR